MKAYLRPGEHREAAAVLRPHPHRAVLDLRRGPGREGFAAVLGPDSDGAVADRGAGEGGEGAGPCEQTVFSIASP